jgi:hypothetical protein
MSGLTPLHKKDRLANPVLGDQVLDTVTAAADVECRNPLAINPFQPSLLVAAWDTLQDPSAQLLWIGFARP